MTTTNAPRNTAKNRALPIIVAGIGLFGLYVSLGHAGGAGRAASGGPGWEAQPTVQVGRDGSGGGSNDGTYAEDDNGARTVASDPGAGYAPPVATASGDSSGNDSGGSGDWDNGYWARQRSQDQRAQSFDGYINDTTTIRDSDTGEIHQDVSNDIANPAIESGVATEVPTADLPTSYDASASTTTTDTSSSVDTGGATTAE